MTCILDSGIPLGCSSTGGIKRVLIANYDPASVFGENATVPVEGQIDVISSTQTWYEYYFRPQTSVYGEEGTHSTENGTFFYSQNVTMTFHKLEVAKRNAILLLAMADLHIIVQTQNGDYWLVGEKNGANTTASLSSAGQAFGDLNGYTITLTGSEPELARAVTSAAIITLDIQ